MYLLAQLLLLPFQLVNLPLQAGFQLAGGLPLPLGLQAWVVGGAAHRAGLALPQALGQQDNLAAEHNLLHQLFQPLLAGGVLPLLLLGLFQGGLGLLVLLLACLLLGGMGVQPLHRLLPLLLLQANQFGLGGLLQPLFQGFGLLAARLQLLPLLAQLFPLLPTFVQRLGGGQA